MPKQQYNFRFEPALIAQCEKLAAADNRSLTNWMETIMMDAIENSESESRHVWTSVEVCHGTKLTTEERDYLEYELAGRGMMTLDEATDALSQILRAAKLQFGWHAIPEDLAPAHA